MHVRQGVSLLTTALFSGLLLGILGITADIGRLYIVHDELQACVESAALAAAYELDGTQEALRSAARVAAAGPGSSVVSNRWNFGTDTVPGIRVTFAAEPGGPFLGQPPAAGIRFVQVSATAAVPMHFLPAVPAIARRQTITATAVAGQTELREIRDGMTPLYAVRLIR